MTLFKFLNIIGNYSYMNLSSNYY